MIGLNTIKTQWEKIWFAPCSPAPICLFRILFGLIVAGSVLTRLPDADLWYGSKGMISVDLAKQWTSGAMSLFFLVEPTPPVVLATLLALIVAALSLAAGFQTRICAAVVWFLLLTVNNRNPTITNSGDAFAQIAAFLLMFSSAGAMYSIDNRLNKRSDNNGATICAPWAQRLLQLQVAAVYVESFFYKYGKEWWEGTATYYAMHVDAYTNIKVPFLFNNLLGSQLTSWGTLGIEFALFTLIWVKELRYWVLLAGLCLHLMLLLTMNFTFLQLYLIAGYSSFLRPEDVEKTMKFLSRRK